MRNRIAGVRLGKGLRDAGEEWSRDERRMGEDLLLYPCSRERGGG